MHEYPQQSSSGPEPEPGREREGARGRSRRAAWIGAGVACALLLGGAGFAAWKNEWFSGNGEAVSFGRTSTPAATPRPAPRGSPRPPSRRPRPSPAATRTC